MTGGFAAWNGLSSTAPPDQGIFLIEGNETPDELYALAYGLEQGNHRFYATLSGRSTDQGAQSLFRMLAELEERHVDRLWELYAKRYEGRVERSVFETTVVANILENATPLDELIEESSEFFRDKVESIEFSMALETDALDLYLKIAQRVPEGDARELFLSLAQEEKRHLELLRVLYRQQTE